MDHDRVTRHGLWTRLQLPYFYSGGKRLNVLYQFGFIGSEFKAGFHPNPRSGSIVILLTPPAFEIS